MALLLFQYTAKRNLGVFLCKFAHLGLFFRICLPAFIFNLPAGFIFFEFSYQMQVERSVFFNFACLFLHNNLPSLVTSLHLFSDFLIALVQ